MREGWQRCLREGTLAFQLASLALWLSGLAYVSGHCPAFTQALFLATSFMHE
jgi:hypothetical protein